MSTENPSTSNFKVNLAVPMEGLERLRGYYKLSKELSGFVSVKTISGRSRESANTVYIKNYLTFTFEDGSKKGFYFDPVFAQIVQKVVEGNTQPTDADHFQQSAWEDALRKVLRGSVTSDSQEGGSQSHPPFTWADFTMNTNQPETSRLPKSLTVKWKRPRGSATASAQPASAVSSDHEGTTK